MANGFMNSLFQGGNGLGSSLARTANNFRQNPVWQSQGTGAQAAQPATYPGWDPSMGRGAAVTTASEMTPFSNTHSSAAPNSFGRGQVMQRFRQNMKPLRNQIGNSAMSAISGNSGGGGQGFGGLGSLSPSGGQAPQLDASAMYQLFGISPRTEGYNYQFPFTTPALQGEGPVARRVEDYFQGPQRTPFGVRFADMA